MGTLDKLIEEEKKHDAYWVEEAKIDFAFSLEEQRRRSGRTYSAIAKALNVSRGYISKVFRGDVNFTIESMTKLARSVDGRLSIRVEPQKSFVTWTESPANASAHSPMLVPENTMTIVDLAAYRDGREIAA